MDQETLKRQLLENYLRQQNANATAVSSQAHLAAINMVMQQQRQQQQYHHPPQPHPSYANSIASSSTVSRKREEPLSASKELVMVNEDTESVHENITLEEFKEYVKKWFELDNMIKKAQEAIKDKKKVRDKLSAVISKFMCKYDIEDLNTKEGRIRCKVKQVKAPINQKVVLQKITDFFKNDETKKQQIMTKIYEERDVVEKVSLRRLKIS